MTVWQKLHNEWPTIAAALVALAVALGGLFGIDPGAIEDAGGQITQVVTSVLGFVAWLHVRRSIEGPQTRKQWENDAVTLQPGETLHLLPDGTTFTAVPHEWPEFDAAVRRAVGLEEATQDDAGGIGADTQGR